MKKGSYGRSKVVGHSPIQRKWNFVADSGGFTDISYIVIFYVNCDNTNIITIDEIGSPILSIQLNEFKIDNIGDYNFDITKTIQTYGSGCYFFAWVDTSGQIQDNQLLISNTTGFDTDNEECIIFTPVITTQWRNGALYNPINSIRGVYIKNPALPINLNELAQINELRLKFGDVNK